MGSPDQRISNCNEVIEAHVLAGKPLAAAYNNRGTAHYARREFDLAIADYTTAIELDGRSARPYGSRALAYKALDASDRALADYNKALELEHGNVFALRGAVMFIST
jgi:tetratricopeptide (TPR) repeat protein